MLAVLPVHELVGLLHGRVQAPAAGLVLPGGVQRLVGQQLRGRGAQGGVPLHRTAQEGAHGRAAVLRHVLHGRSQLVDLGGVRRGLLCYREGLDSGLERGGEGSG